MKRSFGIPQDSDSPVRTYRVPSPPERVVHYPGMAEVAQRAIYAALSGQMTGDSLIAWCEEADGKWPLVGWREAAIALRHRPQPKPTSTIGNIRKARTKLSEWEKRPWVPQQRTREELERQKAEIFGLDGRLVPEGVPF